MLRYEDIGPLNPPPRIDWHAAHFISNNVVPDDRKCLVEFLRDINMGRTRRVLCDRIGNVMLISVCGYIIECDAQMRWISSIEPGVTSP